MKGALKSKHFWAGAITVYVLLSFFPQFSARAVLGRTKGA